MKAAIVTSVLAIAVASAAPVDRVEEIVRRGNAAFERGDFEAALEQYERAEVETTDPGLVAFNEAAALYRLGRYAEAAEHYLRAREDASGLRRARLLYDLGNCLVQQAQERDAAILERAIHCYEECLREQTAGGELRAYAAENLKVAKVMLLRAQAAKSQSESPEHNDKQTREEPEHPPSTSGDPQSAGFDPTGHPYPDMDTTRGSDEGTPTDQAAPGTGNLPPIPDDEKMLPMSREETAAYLREATARIAQARRLARQQHRHVSQPHAAGVKDW